MRITSLTISHIKNSKCRSKTKPILCYKRKQTKNELHHNIRTKNIIKYNPPVNALRTLGSSKSLRSMVGKEKRFLVKDQDPELPFPLSKEPRARTSPW